MKKMVSYAVLVSALFLGVGVAALMMATPASAAGSTCWQVECNICCKSGGKTICTQRACV